MDNKMTQNLIGYVSRWQEDTVKLLRSNDMEFFDMAWIFEGTFYKDCRQLYSSRSMYFNGLFRNDMRKSTAEFEGVTAYEVGGLMSKRYIFDMMRVFCHTGIVQYDKGEPVLQTMDRYSAFHYYGIEGGTSTIRKLLMEVINPTNAMSALEYALNSPVCESEILEDIENYIAIYAFVVFKHRSFGSVKFSNIPGLLNLCSRDDLNIKEVDLLRCMHKLCEKKASSDKDFVGLGNAWDVFTHEFSESGSLWNQLRISSMTMKEFMSFVKDHERFFSNDNIVEIIKFLFSKERQEVEKQVDDVIGEHVSKKRKRFQPISFYPRMLQFHGKASPQSEISYWDDSRIKMFFVFDYSDKNTVTLPPTPFHNHIIHCTVFHSEKKINLRGMIHGRTLDVAPGGSIRITASVVNFRHDRWKKTAIVSDLSGGIDFEMNNILSLNTIENTDISGYLFDIEKYPEYSPNGEWILMSLSVELC